MSSKLNKKTAKKSERITEYSDKQAVSELIEKTEIPKQFDFYKIPRRFGTIPIDELPLGCDKEEQYYKIYPRASLPFQKADRITFGHPNLEPNRLFWGDNLHVMRMLPSNSIDLIYIDPPFFSGRNYNIIFGDQNEIRSFTDIWEGGMLGYLIWLNARLLEMKRLLKPTGCICVHLDWHASHYVKGELDKIFGYDNFISEVIWKRRTAHSDQKQGSKHFGKIHDTLLFYGKSSDYVWHPQYAPYSKDYITKGFPFKEPDTGRYYQLNAITGPGGASKGNPNYEFLGVTRYWRFKKETMEKLYKEGKIVQTKPGNVPRQKRYLDEMPGVELQDIWLDVKPVSNSKEDFGYPTQKPEALLERILKAFTNEGDVVADFFCGGGTTPAVAQRLGLGWVACDQSRVAVAITQGRIESMYEKHKGIQSTLTGVPDISLEYWGTYEIPSLIDLSEEDFRSFVISAFGGRISTSGNHIHGYKRDTPIFVGPPAQNKQISKDDVIGFAKEISTTKGKMSGIILAWAFAPSARKAAEELLAKGNPVVLIQISLTEIESSEFRNHISKLHNEYESFLKFILPPEVRFSYKRLKPLTYEFDVSESIALNSGSKIVNVQWDFDFLGRFTPTTGFAYGRDNKGMPLYKVDYKFNRTGKIPIACRVQDDLGGEKIYNETISIH